MSQIINIINGQFHITENASDAYYVQRGTVYVYVVPIYEGNPGRRELVAVVTEGHNIPAFAYCDNEHREWRFLYASPDNAMLMRIAEGSTQPLKSRFANQYAVPGFVYEGFERGLVNLYGMLLAKEDAFFMRTDNEKESVIDETNHLIQCVERNDFGLIDSDEYNQKLNIPDMIKFGLKTIEPLWLFGTMLISAFSGFVSVWVIKLISNISLCIGTRPYDLSVYDIVACMVLIIVCFSLAGIRDFSNQKMFAKVKTQYTCDAIEGIYEMPQKFLRQYESSDWGIRLSIVGDVIAGIQKDLITVIGKVILIIVLFAEVYMVCPFGTLQTGVLLAVIVFVGTMTYAACKKLHLQSYINSLDKKAESAMFQYIEGINKIHMSGIENRVVYEHIRNKAKRRKADTDVDRINTITDRIKTSIYIITFICMGCYFLFYIKQIPPLSFLMCVLLTVLLYCHATGLNNTIAHLLDCVPEFNMIMPLIGMVPEDAGDKCPVNEITGKIDIENVSFSYDKANGNIINDLSLHINPGEYVGIVGASGSGKSTLVKLLLGFEYPDSGHIYYDAMDITQVQIKSLRRHFGVVLQDGELISGSILDNVRIAAPDLPLDKVSEILDRVSLLEDIDKMPMGVNTMLSENCATISGGQKQRILIARAMASAPDIMFLDEATSALDNITQNRICEALGDMSVTRIAIAHRLSTVKNCDKIYVMDKGSIVEKGTFEELMDKRGIFFNMATRQMV